MIGGKSGKPAGEPPPGGRGAGLLVVALLSTVATALIFVDAAVMRPSPGAPLEALPGFYALFGVLAAFAATALARLLRIILGRTMPPAETDMPNDGDRA
jgi:hypothetical protein